MEDAFGNVTDSDDTTQISISVDACGTRVLGTRTVSAGTAQFPDLRFRTITDPATLQLHALSDTALSGDSATFKVLANPDALFWGGFEGCDP